MIMVAHVKALYMIFLEDLIMQTEDGISRKKHEFYSMEIYLMFGWNCISADKWSYLRNLLKDTHPKFDQFFSYISQAMESIESMSDEWLLECVDNPMVLLCSECLDEILRCRECCDIFIPSKRNLERSDAPRYTASKYSKNSSLVHQKTPSSASWIGSSAASISGYSCQPGPCDPKRPESISPFPHGLRTKMRSRPVPQTSFWQSIIE